MRDFRGAFDDLMYEPNSLNHVDELLGYDSDAARNNDPYNTPDDREINQGLTSAWLDAVAPAGDDPIRRLDVPKENDDGDLNPTTPNILDFINAEGDDGLNEHVKKTIRSHQSSWNLFMENLGGYMEVLNEHLSVGEMNKVRKGLKKLLRAYYTATGELMHSSEKQVEAADTMNDKFDHLAEEIHNPES